MKLIDEWRSAWRWFSVQSNVLGAALAGAYLQWYDKLKEVFPPAWMTALMVAIFILGIIGRVIQQDSASPPPTQ